MKHRKHKEASCLLIEVAQAIEEMADLTVLHIHPARLDVGSNKSNTLVIILDIHLLGR